MCVQGQGSRQFCGAAGPTAAMVVSKAPPSVGSYPSSETAQKQRDPGGQRTGGTIQSGRHGETSTGYDWFGQTSSHLVVAPSGFRADRSLHRVRPVTYVFVLPTGEVWWQGFPQDLVTKGS